MKISGRLMTMFFTWFLLVSLLVGGCQGENQLNEQNQETQSLSQLAKLSKEAATALGGLTMTAIFSTLGFNPNNSKNFGTNPSCPSSDLSFSICDNRTGIVSIHFGSCELTPMGSGSSLEISVEVDFQGCQKEGLTIDGSVTALLQVGPIFPDNFTSNRCNEIPVSIDITSSTPLALGAPEGDFEFSLTSGFLGKFLCQLGELSGNYTLFAAFFTDGAGMVTKCEGAELTECSIDTDLDGKFDREDNCPGQSNPNQFNFDQDTLGNACDNCPYATNEDQADRDADGTGDACETSPPVPVVCGDGGCLCESQCQVDGDCDPGSPCLNNLGNNFCYCAPNLSGCDPFQSECITHDFCRDFTDPAFICRPSNSDPAVCFCDQVIICGDGICIGKGDRETASNCPQDCNVEVCDNTIDDDSDLIPDCQDSDCFTDPACACSPDPDSAPNCTFITDCAFNGGEFCGHDDSGNCSCLCNLRGGCGVSLCGDGFCDTTQEEDIKCPVDCGVSCKLDEQCPVGEVCNAFGFCGPSSNCTADEGGARECIIDADCPPGCACLKDGIDCLCSTFCVR